MMTKLELVWPGRSLVDSFGPRRMRIGRAALGILLLSSRVASAGPTFVVNSLSDVPAGPNTTDGVCETATGNGVCTLRAAIMEANATRDAIVRVPPGVYGLTRLPTVGVQPGNGDLDILSPMRIDGNGPNVTVVDGSDLMRVFRVALAQGADLAELRGLTIRNGRAPANEDGGGVRQITGRLLLENVHVSANDALNGGGIAVSSNVTTLRRSIVEGNFADRIASFDGQGGGMFIDSGATAIVEDSSISRNFAEFVGGGVAVAFLGVARLERAAVVGNAALDFASAGAYGGGIFNFGDLLASNSVVQGNSSDRSGAGIYSAGATTALSHVTLTGNIGWQGPLLVPQPEFGAGLFVESQTSATLEGSIVTGNLDRDGGGEFVTYQASDCDGLVVSADYNIVGSTCPLVGQLAHTSLGSGYDVLAFNGGFSGDVATDSTPAQGAIPPSACLDPLGAPLTTDFRGHRRKASGCDIGAHDAGGLYTPAQLLGVNLVRNGGGAGQELGLGATVADSFDVELYQAPYWAQLGGRMVQLLYGAPGGYPGLANAPTGSGHKFFAGGVEAVTNARQSFDVSAIAAQIDAGNVPYTVAGAFGGYLTDEDRATLVVAFSGEAAFLDEFSIGGFSAADRGGQTRLIRAERTGVLPVGTRFIDLGLSFERFSGTANDGYADAISLTLPEPGSAASLAAALATLAGLARRTDRRAARRAALRRSIAPSRSEPDCRRRAPG